MELRDAVEQDLPAILEIYNEVIANSTAIYSEEPISLDDRLAWFRARQAQHYPILVASDESGVVGVGSLSEFRAWPAGYRFTVEHSVHVRADRRRCGIGRALLETLMARAVAMGKHVIVGVVDADNLGSIKLHDALGFEQAARCREVGRKFGRWLDIIFVQRFLEQDDLSSNRHPARGL
jgi:L-amino acid N-acyltransferase